MFEKKRTVHLIGTLLGCMLLYGLYRTFTASIALARSLLSGASSITFYLNNMELFDPCFPPVTMETLFGLAYNAYCMVLNVFASVGYAIAFYTDRKRALARNTAVVYAAGCLLGSVLIYSRSGSFLLSYLVLLHVAIAVVAHCRKHLCASQHPAERFPYVKAFLSLIHAHSNKQI